MNKMKQKLMIALQDMPYLSSMMPTARLHMAGLSITSWTMRQKNSFRDIYKDSNIKLEITFATLASHSPSLQQEKLSTLSHPSSP